MSAQGPSRRRATEEEEEDGIMYPRPLMFDDTGRLARRDGKQAKQHRQIKHSSICAMLAIC